MMMNKTQIDHPDYYKLGSGEAIDIIDILGLAKGFALGNAIKYIVRAGKKDGEVTQEAIQKAIWYLDHFIDYCEREEMKNVQKS